MKILYLINGLGFSHNTGIGGSDKRAVEIIRNAKISNPNYKLDILTTVSGHKLFTDSEQLQTSYHIIKRPFWWPSFINKFLMGRSLSYIYATLKSLLFTKRLDDYDIYFATSDFFFDVIPAWFYKLKHKKKMICMIHHNIKSPKERGGSLIIDTLMYISQRFSFWFISKTADVVLLYDTDEGKSINTKVLNKKKADVFFVKNGIDTELIDSVSEQNKVHDACFLGGLRYSKGIDEFIPIWKKITNRLPQAKLVVIGGGSHEIVKNLENEIKRNNLERNIELSGPLSGKVLFEQIKKSKVFLFPSHEEGWGIAISEAMYCGLPVICYDLPAFKIFGDIIDRCDIGNTECLTNKVLHYLENPNEVERKRNELKETAKRFSWESITKEELKIYEKIISS